MTDKTLEQLKAEYDAALRAATDADDATAAAYDAAADADDAADAAYLAYEDARKAQEKTDS